MSVQLRLPVFEGPFDLLLHLVRINEMDIQDIRITDITQQYLTVLQQMQELDLEVAGEFLVMAATLISIKARTLLPVPPEAEETQEEIDEVLTTRDLVRQLLEYRRFKEAAAALREHETSAARVFYRPGMGLIYAPTKEEQLSMDLSLLLKAFSRVLKFVDQPGYNPHIYEAFTVEDKLLHLETLLSTSESGVDLDELVSRCVHRAEIVVTFLAMLELCRMKRIAVDQESPFSSVRLSWRPHGHLDEDSDPDLVDMADEAGSSGEDLSQDEEEFE